MVIFTLDSERCKECAVCVHACPKGLLRIAENISNKQGYHPAEMTDAKKCSACAICAVMCADSCIQIEKE